MDPEQINTGIDLIARGLEIVGVAVITLTFVHALVRAALHFGRKHANAYDRLKVYIGKALLLGLEFLVAADIIRTVIIEPSTGGILSLGLLIVVRIALGWSIAVELEGCWPWQVDARERSEARSQRSEVSSQSLSKG